MDFTLPEELKQLQTLARTFIQKELLPLEHEVEEKDDFPQDLRLKLRAKAVKAGLWSYLAPAKYGGGDVGHLGAVLINEELGKVSPAVGLQGGVIGQGREMYLVDFATGEQVKEYVIPFIKGERELFLGITEPNAGSDTFAMETTAVKRGNNYVINGNKTFITMADRADFGLVFAVTNQEKKPRPGITCFLVDKGTPGFTVVRRIHTIGRRGCPVFELNFTDCVVPANKVLGEVDHGLRVAHHALTDGRIYLSAYCVGVAERCLDMAKNYALQRKTFGKLLAQRQNVQTMLVDVASQIYACRMATYHCAWARDQGMEVRIEASMTKLLASELVFRAADMALQIHGGYGISKDLVIERIFRDIRLERIGEGASELLRSWVASAMLGIPFE